MILFFYQKHGPMINARTYCKFQGINASLNTGEEKKMLEEIQVVLYVILKII